MRLGRQTLEWIVQRAREFDGKDVDTFEDGSDDGANALSVLEARPDDTVELELRSWIEDLTESQAAELVALFWLGRDGGEATDFPRLVEEARRARSTPTADYLLGSPHLADHLEAGLDALGDAVEEED